MRDAPRACAPAVARELAGEQKRRQERNGLQNERQECAPYPDHYRTERNADERTEDLSIRPCGQKFLLVLFLRKLFGHHGVRGARDEAPPERR